ncbi:iron dicitrate transporter FecR [Nitrospira sp. KM1]|uniref:FecR family protein n=1 Tax=Nitrospira sp. KM1 TaxID=1936990 RepID=UPI0013A72DFB|nr:FecR family protein [Nitrospira sp. KM1]BCA56563.1 iron dicitrate transporter FecR [Nitrospira sp. KM1]
MVTLDSLVMQSRRLLRHGHHVTPDDRTLSDEAIHWRVRLQSEDLTPEEHRSFEEWKNRTPDHRAAFDKVDNLWRDLDAPSRLVWEEASQGIKSSKVLSPGVGLKWKWGALAASIALVVLAGLWFSEYLDQWTPGMISTARGQRLSITLEDGSTVHLNTDSTISVELTERRRFIRLKKGEATFSVAPDKSRPFDVESAGGITRAVGTEFNVRRHDDEVTVTVTEGTVEVSKLDQANRQANPSQVTVGEQIGYSRRTGIGAVSQADLVQATGWRRGQLVFDLKPLGEVVEEVDRYWPGKILVISPGLRQHRISGVFKTGDPAAVVHALETTFHVKSVTVAGYLVVLYQ